MAKRRDGGVHGRRGGGWVDDGSKGKRLPPHVEAARVKQPEPPKDKGLGPCWCGVDRSAHTPEMAEKCRRRHKAEQLGLSPDDLVPGTGMTWEGAARMAQARAAAGHPRPVLEMAGGEDEAGDRRPITTGYVPGRQPEADRLALKRCPEPRGWVGE